MVMFVIVFGYGLLLLIFLFIIVRIVGILDLVILVWYIGVLMGIYIFVLFLFVLLWGCFFDCYGWWFVIVVGLVGFVFILLLFVLVVSLFFFYFGCFLNGVFVVLILLVVYVFVGDFVLLKEWCVYCFVFFNIVGVSGFFVGLMMGGFVFLGIGDILFGLSEMEILCFLFFVMLGLVLVVVIFVVVFEFGRVMCGFD